ncbi:hypothetical protein BC939DRAFT_471233 [Gamsiella multidivaricata]|uniref:uncharacterized protein n=1 Tax=Gamsiella multidivaricata TaxID=101098 RepID=UPI00221FAC00|nr:uncharacterized protein BC939DRAFT_471233 [Gamsiella multidivaricata]KAI7815859.1 hypothetical protein BC939DRAFT_471233 [Gamsiella multidivaricata]
MRSPPLIPRWILLLLMLNLRPGLRGTRRFQHQRLLLLLRTMAGTVVLERTGQSNARLKLCSSDRKLICRCTLRRRPHIYAARKMNMTTQPIWTILLALWKRSSWARRICMPIRMRTLL